MSAQINTVTSSCIAVELIPHQFGAYQLPVGERSNYAAVPQLQQLGLDCAVHNDQVVLFSPKKVEFLAQGEFLIFNGTTIVEVISAENFQKKYRSLSI